MSCPAFHWLLALALLLLAPCAYPSDLPDNLLCDLTFVSSKRNDASVKEITNSIGVYSKVPSSITTLAGLPTQGACILIATDYSIFQELLQSEIDLPIVSVYSSSHAYHSVISKNKPISDKKTVTAIYAEASPFDFIRLIGYLKKSNGKIVYFTHQKDQTALNSLTRFSSETGYELSVVSPEDKRSYFRLLRQYNRADFILSDPGFDPLNAETFKPTLEMLLEQNQPLIGFTRGMVKGGALAALFADADSIARQLIEIRRFYLENKQLPPPQYPKYLKVEINDRVARSLNMTSLPDKEALNQYFDYRDQP